MLSSQERKLYLQERRNDRVPAEQLQTNGAGPGEGTVRCGYHENRRVGLQDSNTGDWLQRLVRGHSGLVRVTTEKEPVKQVSSFQKR